MTSKKHLLSNKQCRELNHLESGLARWLEELPKTFKNMTPEEVAPYIDNKVDEVVLAAEGVTGYPMEVRINYADPAYIRVQLFPADEEPVRVSIRPEYDWLNPDNVLAKSRRATGAVVATVKGDIHG